MNQSDLNPYIYNAKCTRVYDGDSVTVDIDLGMGVWLKNQKTRLFGIDTPEIKGDEREAGLQATYRLRYLVQGYDIVIETHKDRTGKYGRWLVTLWVDTAGDGELTNVNELLVEEGLAAKYEP